MTDESISPLRQRMIDDMRIRGFSAQTQRGYLRVVGDFEAFLGASPTTTCPNRRSGNRRGRRLGD